MLSTIVEAALVVIASYLQAWGCRYVHTGVVITPHMLAVIVVAVVVIAGYLQTWGCICAHRSHAYMLSSQGDCSSSGVVPCKATKQPKGRQQQGWWR